MTCMYKEHEIETKMRQEQWLKLKMKFLLGYNTKIVASEGGEGGLNGIKLRVFFGKNIEK